VPPGAQPARQAIALILGFGVQSGNMGSEMPSAWGPERTRRVNPLDGRGAGALEVKCSAVTNVTAAGHGSVPSSPRAGFAH